MIVTDAYIKENDDVVDRCFKFKKLYENSERFKIIKDYCKGAKTILSVGCGPYEPVIIKSTHALDISKKSYDYLKMQGWNGVFINCSCDNIPFQDKYFDVVVCSEVLEHLPDYDTAIKTLQEINRVGNRWIVTVPVNNRAEKTHKLFFTFDNFYMLLKTAYGLKPCCKTYFVTQKDIYLYAYKIVNNFPFSIV